MLLFKKGTFILVDKIDYKLFLFMREFKFRVKNGTVEVSPKVKINTNPIKQKSENNPKVIFMDESEDLRTLKKIDNKIIAAFRNSEISTIATVELPYTNSPTLNERYSITAGDNSFSMENTNVFLCNHSHLLRDRRHFSSWRETSWGPLQLDNSNIILFKIHMELLKIYRDIMLDKMQIRENADYYKLLQYLFYLRHNVSSLSYYKESEEFVKRYSDKI